MRAAGDNQGLRFHASAPLIWQGKPLGIINVATAEWQFLTYHDLQFLFAASAQLVAALEGTHFTVFLGVLDLKTHTLQYANAGHNRPLARRADGTIEQLTRTAAAIGIIGEAPLGEATLVLEPGESLLLYTDGVTEAWHSQPQTEDYGIERLAAALRAAPSWRAAGACRGRPGAFHCRRAAAGRCHLSGIDQGRFIGH